MSSNDRISPTRRLQQAISEGFATCDSSLFEAREALEALTSQGTGGSHAQIASLADASRRAIETVIRCGELDGQEAMSLLRAIADHMHETTEGDGHRDQLAPRIQEDETVGAVNESRLGEILLGLGLVTPNQLERP